MTSLRRRKSSVQGGAPEDLESVIHSAKALLDNLQVTISTLNKAATSPEMAQSLQALNHSLVNLDHITKDTSTQIGPLLQSLHSVANSTDTVVKQVGTSFGDGNDGGDLSGTLHELKNAARSMRALSDYLESHPEALIQGKAEKTTP